MAKDHGAKRQKRLAKQKAKRAAKRAFLMRRESKDPTIRLQNVEKWPVVRALVGSQIWSEGIGHLAIARQESEGRLVFTVFLVDVYCLGVKNAFWRAGSQQEFADIISRLDEVRRMSPIAPACLAKLVQGAVEYAQSFGFPPHPDYGHAQALLAGIDPATCPEKFTFGRDGKPFYFQGPHETTAQARAIMQRMLEVGGKFLIQVPGPGSRGRSGIEGELDQLDEFEEDDSSEE